MSVDQQTGQQARLDGFGPAPVVAGIGGELVSNSGPGFTIDQRRMLAGVELTLVRNLTDVNRVREQSVDVSAREWDATALGALRCGASLSPQSEPVSRLLDPPHAAELTIQPEDAADNFGLGGIDDERALVRVIAKRHVAAHPHALLLRRGDLVANAFAVTSRSNWAKDSSTLSVMRPWGPTH